MVRRTRRTWRLGIDDAWIGKAWRISNQGKRPTFRVASPRRESRATIDEDGHYLFRRGPMIHTLQSARSSALRILSRRDVPALSLCGLDPESLRDRGELVADLLNAGGELMRATQIDGLAGHG